MASRSVYASAHFDRAGQLVVQLPKAAGNALLRARQSLLPLGMAGLVVVVAAAAVLALAYDPIESRYLTLNVKPARTSISPQPQVRFGYAASLQTHLASAKGIRLAALDAAPGIQIINRATSLRPVATRPISTGGPGTPVVRTLPLPPLDVPREARMIVMKGPDEGLEIVNGRRIARGIWTIATGEIEQAKVLFSGSAPQASQLTVEMLDSRGAIMKSAQLALSNSAIAGAPLAPRSNMIAIATKAIAAPPADAPATGAQRAMDRPAPAGLAKTNDVRAPVRSASVRSSRSPAGDPAIDQPFPVSPPVRDPGRQTGDVVVAVQSGKGSVPEAYALGRSPTVEAEPPKPEWSWQPKGPLPWSPFRDSQGYQ